MLEGISSRDYQCWPRDVGGPEHRLWTGFGYCNGDAAGSGSHVGDQRSALRADGLRGFFNQKRSLGPGNKHIRSHGNLKAAELLSPENVLQWLARGAPVNVRPGLFGLAGSEGRVPGRQKLSLAEPQRVGKQPIRFSLSIL